MRRIEYIEQTEAWEDVGYHDTYGANLVIVVDRKTNVAYSGQKADFGDPFLSDQVTELVKEEEKGRLEGRFLIDGMDGCEEEVYRAIGVNEVAWLDKETGIVYTGFLGETYENILEHLEAELDREFENLDYRLVAK